MSGGSTTYSDAGQGRPRRPHRVTVFQNGLVKMPRKLAAKGRRAHITGKLRTRKCQDRDGNGRYTAGRSMH